MSLEMETLLSTASPAISVIIPTTCERNRWESLKRAIAGVLTQEGVTAQVIAVVNGNRYDPDCFEELKRMDRVTVLYQQIGSAPMAQTAGRKSVRTPFFAFLDDDDEFLPQALSTRLKPLMTDPQLDFVVTDGYRVVRGGEQLAVGKRLVKDDPLSTLCEKNWMASCGGLFRTSTVTEQYFSDPVPYMEWTYLAFRLTISLRMCWLDTPTYRINSSVVSLSKSNAYINSEIGTLKRILALPLPPHIRRAVQIKIGRTYHTFAENSRRQGQRREAWRFHLESLLQPGGWRYLAYSRKLAFDFYRGDGACA